jgi:hypothetical protein
MASLEVKRVPEIMHKSWTRSALPGDLVDVKRGRKPGACDQNVVLVDLFRINEQSSKPTWEAAVFVPGIGCKLVPATNIIKSEGKRALTSEFNDAMTSYSKFGINFNILAPKRKVTEDASTAGETKKRTKTSSKARGAGAWAGSARRKSRGLLFSKDGKEEEEGKEEGEGVGEGEDVGEGEGEGEEENDDEEEGGEGGKFAGRGKGGNAATRATDKVTADAKCAVDKIIADAKRKAAKVAADANRVLGEKDAELQRLREQLTKRDEESLSRERSGREVAADAKRALAGKDAELQRLRQLVDVKGHKREEEDLSRERSGYYIQREPNNKEIRRAYTTLREENFRLQSRERILTMQLENSRILSADRLAIFASQPLTYI